MLIVRASIDEGRLSQSLVTPYSSSNIHHLTLKLYTTNSGESYTGVAKTLTQTDLNKTVQFTNLKPQTGYRIKAFAYTSADDSVLISTQDAQSYTDVALTTNDNPVLATLRVKLVDRLFNGQATSSLTITPGGYSAIASETLTIPRMLSTYAGSSSGTIDGLGTTAKFTNPIGVTVDGNGNVYVVEGGHRVRKIAPGGYVTTYAGGTTGNSDGTGTNARFSTPYAITPDGNGNLIVADQWNHRIVKIAPGGVVTTIAGNGVAGTANGVGTTAQFNAPRGVAVDVSGNIYVGDYNNHLIRKISTANAVTTYAGGTQGPSDGTGTLAKFSSPEGVALDASGNLYVADCGNKRIRKISPTQVVSTLAGGAGGANDGTGTQAGFNSPSGLTVDSSGNVYVADRGINCIRKVTPAGVVTTIIGNGTPGTADGVATVGQLSEPRGVAIDSFGNVYVADYGSQLIRMVR